MLASFADVPLARHAIFSPQRTSAETSGYLHRPITAHFQILEVTLRGDLENFTRTQNTSSTFNERVSVSDLNSYQLLLSCSLSFIPSCTEKFVLIFQIKVTACVFIACVAGGISRASAFFSGRMLLSWLIRRERKNSHRRRKKKKFTLAR